jgi:hypothetical protein
VGKYGTNLEGFGAFEGGVNADKGAPLVSTSSDGETALLFGPAALREIQAGVANGDFAIPPDEADATITAENPLPYWTFTDVNSAGAITCAIVNDATSASTNLLRWSVAASSTTGKKAKLTRFVAVAGSQNRGFVYIPEITFFPSATTANVKTNLSIQYYKADQTTTTGTAVSSSLTFVNSLQTLRLSSTDLAPTPSAAYALITIEIETTATSPASVTTCDLYEVNLYDGKQVVAVAEDNAPNYYFASTLTQSGGVLTIATPTSVAIANSTAVTGDITATGDIGVDGRIYFDSALTGPYIQQAGTNGRIISVASATSTDGVDLLASTASARSGILITKATTGQPTTTLNGTGATDAFADVLRNGGIAVDSTNNRGYFYSGGWKFAALTTPSDSRLKEEITEITGALDTLRQLVPVAFKWKAPEAHGRTDAVADDGKRLGFIADQVATTDLAHWVETLGVDEREAHLVDTTEVLAVNIPQNEMEALVVQALLDIDTRLKALESR